MNNLSVIESILYAFGQEGVDVLDIKKVCDIDVPEIKDLLKIIQQKYENDESSGLVLKQFGKKYYVLTKETNAEVLSKLIDIKTRNPLTKSLLETLSIIAYNQPCTRGKVSEIRNTDASFAFEKLESLNLIVKKGKADTPGAPFLYETTPNFLNIFGLKSIKNLPKVDIVDFSEEDEISFFDSGREEI